MKLDLTEVANNLGKNYHYDVNEDCAEYEDLRCKEPITGSIDFTNTGRLIVARGKMSTVVELDCGRCLETLTIPVEVTVEEQFPITDLQTLIAGQEEEITEEEKEPLFENNIFDLSEYIRQSVLVEVPIRPLCSEDCKGLCPTCGSNLNEGPCDCPVNIEASPFSVLAELMEEKKSDE